MKRILVAAALLVAILVLPGALGAATIHLKDGRQFSGEVAEKGDKIELNTGYGTLLIDRNDIDRIEGLTSVPPKPPVPKPAEPEPPTPGTVDETQKAVLDSVTSGEMSDHIHYLASEELEGRMTGTEGFKKARDYIVKEFKSYGLKPAGDTETYTQKFTTRAGESWNVIGCIEGSDPKLKSEVVIVGAHYDHIGRGEIASRGGPDERGKVHPGADDNASGTAGVLEIAEAFTEKHIKPKRTVVFICFGSEEMGLLGSRHYCDHPVFPLEKTVAMLNMDMIARNERKKVIVFGLTLSKQLDEILAKANVNGLEIDKKGMTPASDHYSFYTKGVPAILFNSGMHDDLHRPTDLPYKCDFKKSEIIAEVVGLMAFYVANYTGKIEMEKAPNEPDPWGQGRRQRHGPRLGFTPTIAELTAEDRKKYGLGEKDAGILIVNIQPDSIAGKGGLKGDDIIIELDGKKIPRDNLWQVLREVMRGVGENGEIPYTVIRDGKKVSGKLKFP
jgi:hypothetical protein